MEGIISLSVSESSPSEPLTLSEVKDHLKIDFTDRDTYLGTLLTACRQELEEYLGVSIAVKTITIIVNSYNEFTLPYGPITSITSVGQRNGNDGSGVPVYDTVEADDYQRSEDRIYLGEGRFKIIYVTGMSSVPQVIKQQLKRLIAYRNANAGDEKELRIDEIVGNSNKNMSWI